MKILIVICCALITTSLYGQTKSAQNMRPWSSTQKLSLNDFGIKTGNNQSSTSFAQFSVDYWVSGLNFFKTNFNKNVNNYLIISASTIDTTADVLSALRYQQTLFDICEIYTRQFRKALSENRKKILFNIQFVNEQNQIALTNFTQRRVAYDSETNSGTNIEKQIQWETTIKKELEALSEFSNE